jgi:hypothetical protein
MSEISVADGFRFGCGFLLAMLIAWVAVGIVSGILAAIFGSSLFGILDRLASAAPDLLSLI